MKRSMIWIAIAVIIVAGIIYFARGSSAPGKLDAFASCLSEKGATFYGAFWCPHCQSQKKMFGSSEKLLPYVECSAPNGQAQLPVCTEKKIEGYPTWEFADGSRETGEISLTRLSERTGCDLPQDL